jgi:putative endonuclease
MLSAAVRRARSDPRRGVEASLPQHDSRLGNRAGSNVTYLTDFHKLTCDYRQMHDRRSHYVYIMGSLTGTLYVGFSGNLHKRVFQHKFHHFEGFTAKYEVTRLLYWGSYDDVHKALAREKQLKGWSRTKKIALIARRNPHWIDLAAEWYPWMESGQGRDVSTPR